MAASRKRGSHAVHSLGERSEEQVFEIFEDARENGVPVILKRNSRGDMVLMSMGSSGELSFRSEAFAALCEAERVAVVTEGFFSFDEILSEARAAVASFATEKSGYV